MIPRNKSEAEKQVNSLENTALRMMELAEHNGVYDAKYGGPMDAAYRNMYEAETLRKIWKI